MKTFVPRCFHQVCQIHLLQIKTTKFLFSHRLFSQALRHISDAPRRVFSCPGVTLLFMAAPSCRDSRGAVFFLTRAQGVKVYGFILERVLHGAEQTAVALPRDLLGFAGLPCEIKRQVVLSLVLLSSASVHGRSGRGTSAWVCESHRVRSQTEGLNTVTERSITGGAVTHS